jgi:hypothetical protein
VNGTRTCGDERPCPLAFVVLATFTSTLLWLCALLVKLPLR